MSLDSDVANADTKLHTEFYIKEINPNKGMPYVRIIVPGDKTSIIEQPVREDHKERFPRQWLYFQMKREGDGSQTPGLPLMEWNKEAPEDFSVGQMEEMLILKFQTVEQIGSASDAQLQRVGMGGIALRDKARAFLKSRSAVETNKDVAATKKEIAALKAQVARLTAGAPIRRRGRPPKVAGS